MNVIVTCHTLHVIVLYYQNWLKSGGFDSTCTEQSHEGYGHMACYYDTHIFF